MLLEREGERTYLYSSQKVAGVLQETKGKTDSSCFYVKQLNW